MSTAPADCRRSIAQTNPRYHRLIEAFRDLTGVPMVLNTSFNENEPVVCKPEEALDCFLRTKMDVLVLGDIMLSRQEAPAKNLSFAHGATFLICSRAPCIFQTNVSCLDQPFSGTRKA